MYGSLTLYDRPFQTIPLTTRFLTPRQSGRTDQKGPTTPHTQPLPGITRTWFSLFRFRSPLLTESLLFSLPVGTEMFHFPTFPPHALYIQVRVTRHHSCWVSPFGNPRISARLTAPRGLSQPPTSFIGSWCQGIHRTLLITYNKDARVHCAVLKQQHRHHRTLQHQPTRPTTGGIEPARPDPVVLPRKKHSRVLSGPNSVPISSNPRDRSTHRRRSTHYAQRSLMSASSTHEHPPAITVVRQRALPTDSTFENV